MHVRYELSILIRFFIARKYQIIKPQPHHKKKSNYKNDIYPHGFHNSNRNNDKSICYIGVNVC